MDQRNRAENPQTDSHRCAQLILDKGATPWRKVSLFSKPYWNNGTFVAKSKQKNKNLNVKSRT